jgi:hypothetical protein
MLRVPEAMSCRATRSSMTSPPVRVTICWPDDPGVVLRGTMAMAEFELLDSQDAGSELRGEPVERRRAQPAEADDDRAMACHP